MHSLVDVLTLVKLHGSYTVCIMPYTMPQQSAILELRANFQQNHNKHLPYEAYVTTVHCAIISKQYPVMPMANELDLGFKNDYLHIPVYHKTLV